MPWVATELTDEKAMTFTLRARATGETACTSVESSGPRMMPAPSFRAASAAVRAISARAARILDDQSAAAHILDGEFGRLLQGAGNVLGFAGGREGQEQRYAGVLQPAGSLRRGGIIAEQVAHFRHAAAARKQKHEENGEQISPLPPQAPVALHSVYSPRHPNGIP